tara:strand:- start:290 stop:583 length:294 start_codon:yes stop_codon:yes gene_type:complete
MSSLFFSGEKSSKEEAVAALMEEMPDYTDQRFWVRFESDDTSNHLTVIVESKFNATTPDFKLKKSLPPKYMGHRLIIKSVPPDYIDAILLAKEKDDA